MNTLQVLIVEDDPADASLVVATLAQARSVQFRSQVVASLAQMRQVLAAAEPEVLLVDLSLPDSIGLATVQAARELAGALPLIVLTGHDDADFALQTLEAGAQDYLVKGSFGIDTLERAIRYAIGRARLERRLVDAEERWRFALEGAGDAVWDRNLVTGEVYYSRRWKEMLGYADEDIGSGIEEWTTRLHPDDAARVARELDAYLEANRAGRQASYAGERRMRCKDGSWKWILARGMVAASDEQGRPLRMIGTHTDITERKAIEEAQHARQLAEQASRAKSEFVSRISHELRTPLNTIVGFSEILQLDDQAPLTTEQQRRIERIQQAGEHLLLLINDLLDISRIEAGAMKLHIEDLDPVAAVSEAMRDVSVQAAGRHITMALHQALAPGLRVRGDSLRLRQVVLNLLSNAIKYNHSGGRVDVDLRREGRRFRLAVADTGPGMTPEQIQRLFKPFERLGREQGPVEGTGIGLVITRHLVEMMGGQIGVHSQPGKGSEFVLELALAEPDAAADAAQHAATGRRPARRSDTQGRVLYVDDNEANRVLMEGYFALRPGVELHMTADGDAAIAMATEHRLQLALIDMRLPDGHGLRLIERLHAIDPELPCVAVSADAMPDDIAAATAAGFTAYLTKPLTAAVLMATVDRHLLRDRAGFR